MSTQKVIINVDWVPSNFGAAPANEGLACVATGKTLEEVQKNIIEAIRFHLEEMREDGETIRPTTRAQLKYADNYITRKALARETGIAEQQLSHYANGQRHPRPAMQQRISAGIQAICQRLAFIC